jgi:hypothetical protein
VTRQVEQCAMRGPDPISFVVCIDSVMTFFGVGWLNSFNRPINSAQVIAGASTRRERSAGKCCPLWVTRRMRIQSWAAAVRRQDK